ncbi:MAG: bifunctional tetrahydrofolate synthase/dihydrofolate synthase [Burkholderiales bacterium]
MSQPEPTLPRTLDDWLAHCERLHGQTIVLGLERVATVRDALGLGFGEALVFTVAGTNGKGSTCAMLESILLQAGYRVGVYSSPHLVHFEERLRLMGQVVEAQTLLPHFEAVEAARGDTPLTYFEFTTLALMHCLSQQGLDAVVLEVGLGGRLDAVNAIDTDCAIVTSIDLDHQEFLGNDRESIGFEKAGIFRAGRPAIVGDPVPPASVLAHAQAIGAELWRLGTDFNFQGDRQQWGWSGRGRRISALAYPALRGANQLLNAAAVLAALEAVRERLPVPMQAVRSGLAFVELPGRFQIVPGQPALVLDVAHNPHAAAALALNLDQMGFFPRTHAVFGAMADKDLHGLLKPLLNLVDDWYCCDLPTPRAATAASLAMQIATALPQARATPHADPASALDAALAAADPADRILVFGSFYTVGGVLQRGLPRLQAEHAGSSAAPPGQATP